MLAKTHLVFGAMSGALLLPYVAVPVNLNSLPSIVLPLIPPGAEEAFAHALGAFLTIAVSCLGAALPDLDEPHSKISRKIAPVKAVHRRLALLALAFACLYLAFKGWIPWQTGGLLALWLAIPALSKHRGVTHSLLGVMLAYWGIHSLYPSAAKAFVAGHLSHIFCDSLTDRGVPLLWPWRCRFHLPTGMRTGGRSEKWLRFMAVAMTGVVFMKTKGFTMTWDVSQLLHDGYRLMLTVVIKNLS